jgi:DNA-binding MarR family transcriptional regulator
MSSVSKASPQDGSKKRKSLMEELQFLGQMSSTETALFHHAAAAKNGLGITDSKTISTLMQEGDMTAGQIADRLSLTTGAVTSVIDRLENAQFVKRVADPKDRRKVIVTVNKQRLEKMGNVYDSIGEAFHTVLQKYSTEELEFLVAYYKITIELTKLEIAKLSK